MINPSTELVLFYAGDSGCAGSNDASRDRNILNAKIVRIATDGSVPPTNPGAV